MSVQSAESQVSALLGFADSAGREGVQTRGTGHMRRILLGSTALIGAGVVLASQPASAADGIKLGVGGFFRTAYMVNFDDDSEGEPGNEHNTDGVFSDAEIHFTGSTVLDNGFEV